MTDHPDDHAAFCAMCNVPLLIGPLCYECANPSHDEEDGDDMTPDERAEFCAIAITNGNITDAINALMFDGDVRVESVRTALTLMAYLQTTQLRTPYQVSDSLIRMIDTWETQ